MWERKKISDAYFYQEGPGVRKTQFTTEGIKLLNVGNINNGTINLETTSIYISEQEAFGRYKHFLVNSGDLLIACSGIVVDNFHNKIAFVKDEDLPLCLNTSTMRFSPLDNSKYSLRYLRYFLQTNDFKSQLSKLITGSAQLNFGPSHIRQMFLPTPPLPIQEQIAAILDKADKLRRKDQELQEKYDELAQAIFIDMFGDPVRNEKGWEVKKLEMIADVGSSKRVFVEELVKNGIPFYRGTEVGALGNGQRIEPTLFITQQHYLKLKSDSGIPKVGDLLLPSICPDGRIWEVTDDSPFYFKDGRVLWVKVDLSKTNSTFLKSLLKEIFAKNYHKIASGTTFSELKIFILKGLEIPLPPLHLQEEFAKKFELINKLKAKANTERSEELFQSLLQGVFKGELVSQQMI